MIAGIDLSTKKIAVAAIDGRKLVHWTEVTAVGQRAGDRFPKLVHGFRKLTHEGWFRDVEVVFIEDISFIRSRKNELDMAMVQGAVMAQLELAGRTYQSCNNSTVKAAFNMMRQGKAAVRKLVEQTFGEKGLSEDVSDAVLVAMYGRMLLGKEGR